MFGFLRRWIYRHEIEVSAKHLVVCTHVESRGRSILVAMKDRPANADDSGWRLLCGAESVDELRTVELVRWTVAIAVVVDPTTEELLFSKTIEKGDCYERESVEAPWRRIGQIAGR